MDNTTKNIENNNIELNKILLKLNENGAWVNLTKENKALIIQLVSNLLPPEPWDLVNVINVLTNASEKLLNRFNYDGDKWEEILQCTKRGKEIVKVFNSYNC